MKRLLGGGATRTSKTGKILQETKRFEALLAENFDARGADLAEKTNAAAGELPKGIVEKLLFLARLQSQAQSGEQISAADAKQAGYWIAAVRPYLDYGAARGKSDRLRRAIGLIALAIAAYYLQRVWKRRL